MSRVSFYTLQCRRRTPSTISCYQSLTWTSTLWHRDTAADHLHPALPAVLHLTAKQVEGKQLTRPLVLVTVPPLVPRVMLLLITEGVARWTCSELVSNEIGLTLRDLDSWRLQIHLDRPVATTQCATVANCYWMTMSMGLFILQKINFYHSKNKSRIGQQIFLLAEFITQKPAGAELVYISTIRWAHCKLFNWVMVSSYQQRLLYTIL